MKVKPTRLQLWASFIAALLVATLTLGTVAELLTKGQGTSALIVAAVGAAVTIGLYNAR